MIPVLAAAVKNISSAAVSNPFSSAGVFGIEMISRYARFFIFTLGCLFALATFSFAGETVSPQRQHDFVAWLPPQPAGFGPTITNRAAWEKFAAMPFIANACAKAEGLLSQPLPDQSDDLYLEFSRNGNRTRFQDVAFERRSRIGIFTLAEAVDNRGRFLPALEKTIQVLCSEKTWVLPAHDRSLKNFRGTEIEPDLFATAVAAELAQADYILGEKISPATRQLLRDNIRRRVLSPFRAMVEGRQREAFWLRAKMNWNAVCVANTVFTALTLEPDRAARAFFAAAGEVLIQNSLAGFTPDGYCAEGIGYWNYGFGHNVLMAETLRRATAGKVDLFNDDRVIQPALFCLRSEILPGIFPSIADCTPGTKPAADLKTYVQRRLGLKAPMGQIPLEIKGLVFPVMFASLEETLPVVRHLDIANESPLRTFFPEGGVLISRTVGRNPPFAVALKGGHNDEPHNHNDLGSFSVYLGNDQMICDPGGEVYTSRTFSKRRYDSTVLSSYGHAVPLIGGRQQVPGRQAQAHIVATNFAEKADIFTLDLRTAYDVPEIKKLERTFVFQRGESPSLVVRDEFVFSRPTTFETALVIWGQAKQLDEHTLEVRDGDGVLRVEIEAPGRAYKIEQEILKEDMLYRRQPVRIGISFSEKMTDGVVSLRFLPVN